MNVKTDSLIVFHFSPSFSHFFIIFHLHKFISNNIRKLNGLEVMLHVIFGIVRLVVHIFARSRSANIHLFRVINRNRKVENMLFSVINRNRERWKICPKLTLKSVCYASIAVYAMFLGLYFRAPLLNEERKTKS